MYLGQWSMELFHVSVDWFPAKGFLYNFSLVSIGYRVQDKRLLYYLVNNWSKNVFWKYKNTSSWNCVDWCKYPSCLFAYFLWPQQETHFSQITLYLLGVLKSIPVFRNEQKIPVVYIQWWQITWTSVLCSRLTNITF